MKLLLFILFVLIVGFSCENSRCKTCITTITYYVGQENAVKEIDTLFFCDEDLRYWDGRVVEKNNVKSVTICK